ncbi:MAG: terminase [Blastocatellia bacterium]
MRPAERSELLSILQKDKRPWKPLPGPQTLAYHSLADKLFYGGAAGGGKTDLLVGLAGTAHYKSIIFRREFPQLKDVVQRIQEIYGRQQKTRGDSSTYAISWEGERRILELGSVPHEKNVARYKGRPHGLKAFDEISDFSESIFRFLCGWARSTNPTERVRVVACGNPPTTPEGEWVIVYWAPWLDDQHPNPALPGELRWFATVDGKDVEVESNRSFTFKGEVIHPESRTFIPASLDDNPYFSDGRYRRVLMSMPEPLRSQLLRGDFRAGKKDDAWQVIPTAWVERAMDRWRQTRRPDVPMSALGLDVARGGIDKTSISRRYELWFDELITHPGTDTPDGPVVAQYVIDAILSARGNPYINVDVIGYGSSPYDLLAAMGYETYPVNVGERSEYRDRTGKLRAVNVRAESLWRLREALDPDHGEALCLPPSRTLKADLCAPRWSLTAAGIVIESKDEVKKRIGRSPDEGDALALAYMPPKGRAQMPISGGTRDALEQYRVL